MIGRKLVGSGGKNSERTMNKNKENKMGKVGKATQAIFLGGLEKHES